MPDAEDRAEVETDDVRQQAAQVGRDAAKAAQTSTSDKTAKDQTSNPDKTAKKDKKAKDPLRSGSPATRAAAARAAESKKPRNRTPQKVGNPTWWVPVMCALMIIGVLWVATFYISGGSLPVDIGYWNLGIGLGLIMVGFAMTTRWT